MKKRRRVQKMTGALVMVWAWSLMGVGAGAAAIPQVDPNNGLLPFAQPTGVTLTVLDTFGNDITGSWLPEPGETIEVRLNIPGAGPLVPNALILLPETTRYPGICTNAGDPQDTSPDYEILSDVRLKVNDCGGEAAILVNGNYAFVLPADANRNGLPDIWEQQESAALSAAQCPNPQQCFQPEEDNELIGANLFEGDGLAAIDEFRGFFVSGVHVRTRLTQKDVFMGIVNPQCSKVPGTPGPTTSDTDSIVGKEAGDPRTIYPIDGSSLVANSTTLGGGTDAIQFHLLNYTPGGVHPPGLSEWVDNFQGIAEGGGLVYLTNTDGPISDRQINQNAVQPFGIHKGIRLIECLDNEQRSPIGKAIFPPGIQVGHPDVETNSVFYSQRIWDDYENVLKTLGKNNSPSAYRDCALELEPTCVYYQTYEHGFANNGTPKTTPTTPVNTYVDDQGQERAVNRDFVVSEYIKFVVAQEKGHSVALIPEIQIAEYGPHFAPGSGGNMDQRVVVKDSKKVGGVIFSIPTAFSNKASDCFQLADSGGVTGAEVCQ